MPACTRRDFLRIAAVAILAARLDTAWGEDMLRLHHAELVPRGEYLHLVGGFAVQLTPTLEEALRKGVVLTFVQLFEADRPRDFWFAEDLAVLRRSLRISYNALLRLYQIQHGSTFQTFDTQAEALTALGDFADWPVLERKPLSRKHLYTARTRMYLDTTQLPKPLQLNAFASDRWEMDSGWREWTFKP
jgi:hypothetical protein